jgi:hypothetical protein
MRPRARTLWRPPKFLSTACPATNPWPNTMPVACDPLACLVEGASVEKSRETECAVKRCFPCLVGVSVRPRETERNTSTRALTAHALYN